MKSSNQLTETISAAARVGALILAITLFAVIWETDGKSRDRWLAQRDKATSTYKVAAHQTRPTSRRLARKETVVRREISPRSQVSKRSEARHIPVAEQPESPPSQDQTNVNVADSLWSNLKLPDAIAPGNYRIVDTLGRVEFMQLGNGTAGNGPMLYTVESNGVTTFFIRLDEIPTDIKTATGDKPSTRS